MHKHSDSAGSLLPIKDELAKELEWAQSRPQSQAHGAPRLTLASDEPFAKSLTFAEERYRASYAEMRPGQAWQLNQNPDAGFGASSSDHCLPTIIANVHLLFTERVSPARWLLGSELLCSQGFPVAPYLWGIPPSEFPILCSFNLERPSRTSRQIREQSGDTMNVFVMTILALHGILEWEHKPLPSLFANIRLSREFNPGPDKSTEFRGGAAAKTANADKTKPRRRHFHLEGIGSLENQASQHQTMCGAAANSKRKSK